MPMNKLEQLTAGKFQTFQHTDGRKIVRQTGGVRLPTALSEHVETFSGLHGFPLDAKPALVANTSATGVTPAVIEKVYGISSVTKSGKQNIQAIGQFQGQYVSPTDLSKFCKSYDSGADCSIEKFIGKNTASQPGVESMLDTEYIEGLGKGVDTWVYSYPNFDFCADLLTWAGDVAGESQHPYVVSLSYGSQKIDFCDGSTTSRLSQDVQKLGAMVVTVVIASGDDGSGGISRQGSNNGKLSPSFPASIPYALAVGSTFFESGLSGEEQATTQFGSGGGFSYDYDMPSYQADAVKAYLAKSPLIGTKSYASTGRASPDVSLLGEQFTVEDGGRALSVGGTSASTPSWGAIISLLNEDCLSASGGSKTLGFVNPLLYANPSAFNDITKGNNAVGENAGNGWKCTEGWDAATGLGTPNFAKLQAVVKSSCGGAPGPSPPSPPSPPAPPSPPVPPSPPPSPPSSTHYEKPPCRSDEQDVSIQGFTGSVCTPKCTNNACPTDVPADTTVKPSCVLQDSSSGDKYCALTCLFGGCPTGATCQHSGLIGLF